MRELCHNEGNEKAVTDPFYLPRERTDGHPKAAPPAEAVTRAL